MLPALWIFLGPYDLTQLTAGTRAVHGLPELINILLPLQESDTDLEVVLEKKGNMDEACIDQV